MYNWRSALSLVKALSMMWPWYDHHVTIIWYDLSTYFTISTESMYIQYLLNYRRCRILYSEMVCISICVHVQETNVSSTKTNRASLKFSLVQSNRIFVVKLLKLFVSRLPQIYNFHEHFIGELLRLWFAVIGSNTAEKLTENHRFTLLLRLWFPCKHHCVKLHVHGSLLLRTLITHR